jgi:AraC family transcriptional regulator
VEELAREKGLSRSNFSHLFRSATGESPGDYLRRKRLDRAMELLRQSRLSIKEIAARTGFADSTHFCKSFRARYQMSPGAFRRMARVM